MVALNEPMYDSLKVKDVVCLLGHQGFLMQLGMKWKTLHIQQTDLGLNKKIDSGHLFQLCYGLSERCNLF